MAKKETEKKEHPLAKIILTALFEADNLANKYSNHTHKDLIFKETYRFLLEKYGAEIAPLQL